MEYSVTIKSSLEFVLVGPFYEQEGIYVKSDSVDIDVIGSANKVYQRGYSSKNMGKTKTPVGHYVWSRSFTLFDRNLRFLFFWKERNERIFGLNVDYNSVEDELNRFIENSFSQLKGIVTDSLNSEVKITNRSKILWDISPLLLECLMLD